MGANLGHNERELLVGVALMVASIVVSLGVAAIVVRRLPTDYLISEEDPPRAGSRCKRAVLATGQNALALVLVFAGIIMSVPGVPGQGLLTVLVGVILLRFPGKRALERRLFARPRALHVLNRFRGLVGCSPLAAPRDRVPAILTEHG